MHFFKLLPHALRASLLAARSFCRIRWREHQRVPDGGSARLLVFSTSESGSAFPRVGSGTCFVFAVDFH